MKKSGLVLVVLAVLSIAAGAVAKTRYIKSTYISDGAVAVSCSNGGDPTGRMVGGALIISCGTVR
jgi:capsular polysaccharide biosynthesis protein